MSGSKTGSLSAYPGKWERNGREGFVPGMSREEAHMARMTAALACDPELRSRGPEELVKLAERLTDALLARVDARFDARVGQRSGGAPGGNGGSW